MPDTHLFADLLEPEEWQALIDAGFIPPDYKPLRYARQRRQTLQEFEHQWLEREMRKRPTGHYAKYLAGGPLPKDEDECPENKTTGST